MTELKERSRMRNSKYVRNSLDVRLMCCWDTCDRDGFDLYKVILHEHIGRCDEAEPSAHPAMVFCSERHKQYHVHSTKALGNLPPGYRYQVG